jgi:hypothetical protein
MKLLKFKPFTAPKRQVFEDPDTQYVFEARSRAELINLIINYRTQNELPPLEYLSIVIEHYQCGLAENSGCCQPLQTLQRGVFATIHGGMAVLKNVFFGLANMVDQSTASARSAICKGCKYNVFPDKGAFISWSDELAEQATGGRKSEHHNELGNCDVCSCPLRAKVFSKGPFHLTKEQYEDLPDFCWQRREAKING